MQASGGSWNEWQFSLAMGEPNLVTSHSQGYQYQELWNSQEASNPSGLCWLDYYYYFTIYHHHHHFDYFNVNLK